MKIQNIQQKLEKFNTVEQAKKVIDGSCLDKRAYNRKLKIAQYLFDNPDEQVHYTNLIWSDLFYFCYLYFKNDKGEPFRLEMYQDAIASCRHDRSNPDDENRYILFKAANQIGKSGLLNMLAIYYAWTETNVNIVMVSKNFDQSKNLLSDIKQRLNNSVFSETWRDSVGEQANATVLTFVRENGKIRNRIICAPSGEGILGYPVHYLFLDEFDFYEDSNAFFWGMAEPRTSMTKGQIIGFSNPNFNISRSASILWELWGGKSKDFFPKKFSFTFLDASWNTEKEFNKIKKAKPSYMFDSTHCGKFSPDGGGFFSGTEIEAMMQTTWKNTLPFVDKPVYIGLDLAKVKDHSVLVLGTLETNKEDEKISDLHVRYTYRFPSKTDYDIVVQKLGEVIDYYKKNFHGVARVGFDATGVGKAVEDMIKSKGISATPVIFSLGSKSKMYGNFKMLAEQRRIKIVHDDQCKEELANLIFARTPAGYLTVKHERETDHDDFPDALCALIDISVMPSTIAPHVTIVRRGHSISDLENIDKTHPYYDIWKDMGLIQE